MLGSSGAGTMHIGTPLWRSRKSASNEGGVERATRPYCPVRVIYKKREGKNERTLILREHSNIESSPSMYQEAAFLATDESREKSREESMYRARDVHPWGWDSLQNNTTPGAWQTDSADHSQINYDKVRRLWDCVSFPSFPIPIPHPLCPVSPPPPPPLPFFLPYSRNKSYPSR